MSSPELVKKNVKHVSPSSLSTWDECRRKWGKQYAEGRKGLEIARASTLGSFVHAILEGLYALPPKQRIAENAQGLASREFGKLENGEDWPVLNPDSDSGFTREFKLDAWDSVLNAIEIEDPEEVDVAEIEIQLGGTINGVPFKGFVDRLDNGPGGTFVVNDYKNGKVPTFKSAKRKAARQLVLYAANLTEMKGYEINLARFIYTTHRKIVPVKISKRLLSRTGEHLAEEWEAMHVEEEYAPTTSALCAWCPFVLECPEGKAVARARMLSGESVGESTRILLQSE